MNGQKKGLARLVIVVDRTSASLGEVSTIDPKLPFKLHFVCSKASRFTPDEIAFLKKQDVPYESRTISKISDTPAVLTDIAATAAAKDPECDVYVVTDAELPDFPINLGERKRIHHEQAIAGVPARSPGDPPQARAAESTAGPAATILILMFLLFIASTLAVMKFYGGQTDVKLAADFGAYVLPAFAALSGGMGLFYRRKESLFYFISGFAFTLGFVAYLVSKHAEFPSTAQDPYFTPIAVLTSVAGWMGVIASGGLIWLDKRRLGSFKTLKSLNAWLVARRITYILLFILSFGAGVLSLCANNLRWNQTVKATTTTRITSNDSHPPTSSVGIKTQ